MGYFIEKRSQTLFFVFSGADIFKGG